MAEIHFTLNSGYTETKNAEVTMEQILLIFRFWGYYLWWDARTTLCLSLEECKKWTVPLQTRFNMKSPHWVITAQISYLYTHISCFHCLNRTGCLFVPAGFSG